MGRGINLARIVRGGVGELVGSPAEAGPDGIFVDVLEMRLVVAGVFDAPEGEAWLPGTEF